MKSQIRSFVNRNRFLAKHYFNVRGVYSFSENNIDRKLAHYLPKRGGFYVELGANDGRRQSNTKYFEVFKGWNGVLIEPHHPTFKRLIQHRSSSNHFFNVACVPFDFKKNCIELTFADLMTIGFELESDVANIESHLAEAKRFMPRDVQYVFSAKAMTLQGVLENCDAPFEIDLLSLDVEGSELEVLKGVSLDTYTFTFMIIECRNLARLEEYLSKYGYSVIDQFSRHDFLFKRNDKYFN